MQVPCVPHNADQDVFVDVFYLYLNQNIQAIGSDYDDHVHILSRTTSRR